MPSGLAVAKQGTSGVMAKRRVNRGQLALPDAAAGLDVEEVVEEAFVSGGARLRPVRELIQEPEPAAGCFGREWPEEHATLNDHREARQGHPHGGDAARSGRVGFVPDQSVVGITLFYFEAAINPAAAGRP